jgi:hypothetical protein
VFPSVKNSSYGETKMMYPMLGSWGMNVSIVKGISRWHPTALTVKMEVISTYYGILSPEDTCRKKM